MKNDVICQKVFRSKVHTGREVEAQKINPRGESSGTFEMKRWNFFFSWICWKTLAGDYVLSGDCWQHCGVFVLFFFCRAPDPCGSRSHRRGDEQPPERSGGPDYKPRHAAARAGGSGGRACAARRGRSPQRRRRVRSGSGSAAMAVPGQGAGAARRRGRLPLLLLGLAVSGGGRAPGRRGAVRGVSSFPGAGTGRGRWARPEELGESWERDGPLGLGAAATPAGRTPGRSGRARHGTARHGWAPAALLPGVPLPSGVCCFHSLPFAKKTQHLEKPTPACGGVSPRLRAGAPAGTGPRGLGPAGAAFPSFTCRPVPRRQRFPRRWLCRSKAAALGFVHLCAGGRGQPRRPCLCLPPMWRSPS